LNCDLRYACEWRATTKADIILSGLSIIGRYMNLRQLEILRAVVRCETMLGAARELGISQPAISNAIKHMETQLGFALFERIGHRLRPTEEAKVVIREAEPIFLTHASLEARIHDLKENKIGQVRVLATPPAGYTAVPIALKRFLEQRPRTTVMFDIRSLEMVCDSVENHAADIGLALEAYERPSIETEVFFRGEMVCVFQRGHAFEQKEFITPKDLAKHPLIALERGTKLGTLVRRAFEQVDEPFRFSVEVRYGHTACVLAESGVGVSIVDPLSPICSERSGLESRPFRPSAPVTGYVIRSRTRPLSQTAMALLKQIRQVGEEMMAGLTPGAQESVGDNVICMLQQRMNRLTN
jgi:DNA-binding transcriptional LysR family regulator